MGEMHRVCSIDDLPTGVARRFDVAGTSLAVVRIEEEVFALSDTCSHEDYSLSEGEVWADDCAIECPKHGSTFDLRTGEPQTLPATKAVPAFAVRVDGGDVLVELP